MNNNRTSVGELAHVKACVTLNFVTTETKMSPNEQR